MRKLTQSEFDALYNENAKHWFKFLFPHGYDAFLIFKPVKGELKPFVSLRAKYASYSSFLLILII